MFLTKHILNCIPKSQVRVKHECMLLVIAQYNISCLKDVFDYVYPKLYPKILGSLRSQTQPYLIKQCPKSNPSLNIFSILQQKIFDLWSIRLCAGDLDLPWGMSMLLCLQSTENQRGSLAVTRIYLDLIQWLPRWAAVNCDLCGMDMPQGSSSLYMYRSQQIRNRQFRCSKICETEPIIS